MNAVIQAAPAAPQQTATPGRPPTYTTPVTIEKYRMLRDRIAEIRERHKKELEKPQLVLATLEAWLLDDLNRTGAESLRTQEGTIYKTTRTTARVTDWPAVLDFIRANGLWELLESRVSKTAALAIVEDTQKPVPGVVFDHEVSVGVRKPT